MASHRPLTREESKAVTRQRLLRAAALLLAQYGSGALSVSAVARAAGVAQPTFYVHFSDREQLLEALAEEQIDILRARLRDARQRYLDGHGVDALQDICRLPLETWLALPDLLKLHVQEVHQPRSAFGRRARALRDEVAAELVDDLIRLGIPAGTDLERQRLRMIADALLAQTDALALGLIDRRYRSLEDAIDVLMGFALSLLTLADPGASRKGPGSAGKGRAVPRQKMHS